MTSRYSPSYAPLSPPWSNGSAPACYDGPPRAPVMPYRALPAVDTPPYYIPPSPHHGLITPPPSDAVNPLLSASPTIVRYDFTSDPRTIRMSSSVRPSTFPTTHPASIPSHTTIHVVCEASGMLIPIRNDNGITCADLFMQLHAYFAQPLPSDEWRRVPEPQRSAIKAAFNARAARRQDPTMRMVDYLEGHTAFKRLTPKRGGRARVPTWLLQTTA